MHPGECVIRRPTINKGRPFLNKRTERPRHILLRMLTINGGIHKSAGRLRNRYQIPEKQDRPKKRHLSSVP